MRHRGALCPPRRVAHSCLQLFKAAVQKLNAALNLSHLRGLRLRCHQSTLRPEESLARPFVMIARELLRRASGGIQMPVRNRNLDIEPLHDCHWPNLAGQSRDVYPAAHAAMFELRAAAFSHGVTQRRTTVASLTARAKRVIGTLLRSSSRTTTTHAVCPPRSSCGHGEQ